MGSYEIKRTLQDSVFGYEYTDKVKVSMVLEGKVVKSEVVNISDYITKFNWERLGLLDLQREIQSIDRMWLANQGFYTSVSSVAENKE